MRAREADPLVDGVAPVRVVHLLATAGWDEPGEQRVRCTCGWHTAVTSQTNPDHGCALDEWVAHRDAAEMVEKDSPGTA